MKTLIISSYDIILVTAVKCLVKSIFPNKIPRVICLTKPIEHFLGAPF
jgi:hypothetical protein